MGSFSIFHYLIVFLIVCGVMAAIASSFPKPYRRMFVWIYLILIVPLVIQIIAQLLGVVLISNNEAHLLSAALFWYPAYQSYKAAKTNEVETPPIRRTHIVAVSLLSFVAMFFGVAIFTSISPAKVVGSFSGGPVIEGRYQDGNGSTAEFIKDGTAIFVIGGRQGVWTWQDLDGRRIKLTPGPNLIGPTAAVCTYAVTARTLNLSDCPYALKLTRR